MASISDNRDELVEQYRVIRQRYQAFGTRVESLIRDIAEPSALHVVSSRAKTVESFFQKAVRRDSVTAKYVYETPLEQIEDLAGVRIICFTMSQVEQICVIIRSNFDVSEEIDKARELIESGRVGYVSKHFVVRVHESRRDLAEYSSYKDLKCEVQVRTVFQHAWAEVEHRLQYKGSASPDPELRARFQALAGLVQVADREFEGVFTLGRALTEKIEKSLEALEPANNEISGAVNINEDEIGQHKLTKAAYMFGASAAELVGAGDYDKAVQAYNELIALQPRQAWHYVGRAKAFALMGDLDGVRRDIEKIGSLKSKDARMKDVIKRLSAVLF